MGSPRPFTLERDADPTGNSGTGTVAEGVEFSDGVVALRWLVPPDAPVAFFPTSVVFHDRGIESVHAVHGHGGQTRIVWSDPPLGRDQIEQGQSARQRLAAWRRQELAAGHRIGDAEEVRWLCGQLDALTEDTSVQVLPVQHGAAHASAAEVEDIAKAGP